MEKTNSKRLFRRHKTLLALLQAFGGNLSNVSMQKYLFLYTQIFENEKSYDFVPYKFGCFSFQSYADRRRLIESKLLLDEDIWSLADSTNHLENLSVEEQNNIMEFAHEFRRLTGKNLIRKVYNDYPYYAINSEIAHQIMSGRELKRIEIERPTDLKATFYTIGYEGGSVENYLNRLIKNGVKIVCDVRKNPLSRKYGFSKSTLSTTLNKLGIDYIHFSELGITSEKRRQLKTKSDYQSLFKDYDRTILKRNGAALQRLVDLFNEHQRIAITCFEADHCMCHRSRISNSLENSKQWDIPVEHI